MLELSGKSGSLSRDAGFTRHGRRCGRELCSGRTWTRDVLGVSGGDVVCRLSISGRLRVGYLRVLVALLAHLQCYRHVNYSKQQECSRSYTFSDDASSKTEGSVYCILN